MLDMPPNPIDFGVFFFEACKNDITLDHAQKVTH